MSLGDIQALTCSENLFKLDFHILADYQQISKREESVGIFPICKLPKKKTCEWVVSVCVIAAMDVFQRVPEVETSISYRWFGERIRERDFI